MRSVVTAWQRGASAPFCVLLFQDQRFVSGFVSHLSLQGIIFFFIEKWLLSVVCCVLPFCSFYLSHKEKRRPIPARTKTGGERSARQWSSWALHTQNTHIRICSIWWTPKTSSITLHDTKVKDSNYQTVWKQTPWTVCFLFQSDWQIRMTVSSVPGNPVLSSQRLSFTKRLLSAER